MMTVTRLAKNLFGLGLRPSLEQTFTRLERKAEYLARKARQEDIAEEKRVKHGN